MHYGAALLKLPYFLMYAPALNKHCLCFTTGGRGKVVDNHQVPKKHQVLGVVQWQCSLCTGCGSEVTEHVE